jgi:hypothetical protein
MLAAALPQRNRGGNGQAKAQTAQQQAAQIPQGISTATDGSTILDDTVTVKYAYLRIQISSSCTHA